MYNQPYAGPSTFNPYAPPPHPPHPPHHPPPPPPHSHSFPPPQSQPPPMFHQPVPVTPGHHYRQPTLHYSSSPGTPTPTMSHPYHDPPSPTPPFSNSPSTSYTHAFHAPRQQPSYMSPALTHQFDGLSTASPLLLQSQAVGGPAMDLAHPEESHVTIHEYGPSEGTQGMQMSVKCHVHFPPTPPSSESSTSPEGQGHGSNSRGRAMRLVFGSHPVPTKVHILSQSISGGQICQLSANVPAWQSTGTVGAMERSNRVPLHLQVLAGGSTIMETVLVGEYTYTSINSKGPVFTNYTPSGNPLKRAGEAIESHRPSPNQFLHRRALSNGIKLESPELQQYGQFQQPYVGQGGDGSTYSSPYLQQGAVGPVAQPAYSPSAPQPSLMRATQVITPLPAQSNPYILAGGNKASLELVGDLDAMSKGWNEDEWVCRRRLVQFWRRQDGTTISAAFRALPQAEYPQQQQSIIVSCIYREDKNACFVTSVDTIYLLEALVGTRFTVEEKNRIRRNLEGFRPITVSKNKAGSEDFFKTIMGFPNPKPRNIEKDVKVFPWEILGQALKKIIGKYSASYSYSSAGSAMSTPTLTDQPQLPAASYRAHMPEPVPASFSGAVLASGLAPPVLSNSSSSSSYEAHQYPVIHPQTPQMTHHHSNSQSANRSPTDHFGTNSTPSEDKHHEYVNLSPSNHSPYAPTTSNQQGHQRDLSGSYWQSNMGIGIGVGGSSVPQGQHDAALPSPAVSSGSYATLPGPGGYTDQAHQLPHVHETSSNKPSSSDLRVMYTGMAQ